MTNTAGSSGFRSSAIADGQWHSFGRSGENFAVTTRASSAISSGRTTRSFGNSRVGSSAFTNSGVGRNSFVGGNRFGGSAFSPRESSLGRGFGNRGFGGFGEFGRGWRGGFGRGGCWNCGWGWGWGWPYWGFGWGYPGWLYPGFAWGGYWDPYWYDPAWGWDNYDFGYYTDSPTGNYNGNSVYSGSPNTPLDFDYDSSPNENSPSSQASPDTNPTTGNVAESKPTVLLYLKDGTMYVATDYWLSGSKLHYVVSYGGESTIDMDQFDLQRTVDENAKRGIRISLRPKSDTSSSIPTATTPSPAPRPAPQMQAASQLQKST
jgi:hypothetical protein